MVGNRIPLEVLTILVFVSNLMASSILAQEQVEFSPMAIQIMQHDLGRAELLSGEPTGIWDEETRQAMNVWLGRDRLSKSPITVDDLRDKYFIKMITQRGAGQAEKIAGTSDLPFMFLDRHLVFGGSTSPKSLYDPTLSNLTILQCASACAADPNCNGIVNTPSGRCDLMSRIGYWIDNRSELSNNTPAILSNKTSSIDWLDDRVAILVTRPTASKDQEDTKTELARFRTNFSPTPLPALPESFALAKLGGEAPRVLDLTAFPSRPKVKPVTAVARSNLNYLASHGNEVNVNEIVWQLVGYPPLFESYDWIFISEGHLEAANAWEKAVDSLEAFENVSKLFETALAEAEGTYGKKHPVLAFLYHDMAEALHWHEHQSKGWITAESNRHLRMSNAARLLLETEIIGYPDAAKRQLAIQIGSIFSDPLFWDRNPVTEENILRQSGRCHKTPKENQQRSASILRAVDLEIQSTGITPITLGWLKRAENCQNDPDFLEAIANSHLTLAAQTDSPYIQSAAWAGLGRIQFNAGKLDEAKASLVAAISVFSRETKIEYMNFVHDFRGNLFSSSIEYYYGEDPRRHNLSQIMRELRMDDALRHVLMLEFGAMVKARDLGTFGVDSAHRSFIEEVLSLGDSKFASAILAELDMKRSGRSQGQPLLAFFSVLEAVNYQPQYNFRILDAAQILTKLPEPPDQLVKLLTLIAESKEFAGDIEAAGVLSRRALDLVAEHEIPSADENFTYLQNLVAKARREAGDVRALSKTLANELEERLEAVCSGSLSFKAFPTLPIDQLYDDPLLSSNFLESPVIADYLDCFKTNTVDIEIQGLNVRVISVMRLLDLAYVLGRQNQKYEALSLFRKLSPDWLKHQGIAHSRLIAASRLIDGLALAERTDWLEEMRAELQFSSVELQGKSPIILTQLAYSFHMLGWKEEQDAVESAIFTIENLEYTQPVISNGEFSCKNHDALCVYALFKATEDNSVTMSKDQLSMLLSNGLYFIRDRASTGFQSAQNGVLYLALHQKAKRTYIAKILAQSLYLDEGHTFDYVWNRGRLSSDINSLKFLQAYAETALETGDLAFSRKITSRIIRETKHISNSFASYGHDPVIRMSERLRPFLEMHLASSTLPLKLSREDIDAEGEDLVFAGQVLQVSNTAATFAKLSSRIKSQASVELRELQQVASQINSIYDSLADRGSIDRVDAQLADLQARRRTLVEFLYKNEPKNLAGTSLQFPKSQEVMDILEPSEAIISYYLGDESSYAWLFKNDQLQVRRLSLTEQEAFDLVHRVRQTTTIVGFEKPLDIGALSEAYELLVAPFESDLKSIDTLILVPDGPLGSLPFGALVSRQPSPEASLLKEDIRDAKLNWLIRDFTLAQVPSLSSAHFLRQIDNSEVLGQKPFFGIGNPVFDSVHSIDGQVRGADPSVSVARLPETEVELRAMAGVLQADPSRDLLLSDAANERELRSAQLSDYRTISFATHGLIANELPGVTEPALLLTLMPTESESNDGVLLASEIASLKLNANMVILSACNTASSDGTPGAEGLSGLASAFIFAGARQLMVTHWRIPSLNALEISIGTSIYQSGSGNIGWPSAMRNATLDLIDVKGDSDSAHPINWAAYILIGMP